MSRPRLRRVVVAVVLSTSTLIAGAQGQSTPAPEAGVASQAPDQAASAGAMPLLQPGTPLELELKPASPDDVPVREFALVSGSTGSLTIDARSFDDDVVLSRLAEDGSEQEVSDDGGIGWNARQLVETQADERLRFRVRFKRPLAGRVVVEASTEPAPLPEGFDLGVATAKWQLGRAAAAQARGDVLEAGDAYHQAGQTFFALGLLSDCQLAYRACQPLAEASGHPLLKMVVPGFLGAVAVGFGRPAEARGLLEAGRDAAVSVQHAPFEQFCQSKLAEADVALGRLEDARVAIDRALFIARALEDRSNEAGLLAQDAALRDLEGDSGAARDLYLAARAEATEIGDTARLGYILRVEGQWHRQRGEWDEADRCFEESLANANVPTERVAVLGEQGNMCQQRGQWDQARELYDQVLDVARELGDAGLEAAAIESLGVLAYRMGDFDEASLRLHAVLDGAAAADAAVEVRVRTELAAVEFERGRTDSARRELDRALDRAKVTPSDDLEFGVQNQLALLDAGDPARLAAADGHATRLVELARGASSRERLADALSMAAWVAHLRGREDDAQSLIDQALAAIEGGAPPHIVAAVQSTRLEIALARRDLAAVRAALADSRGLLEVPPVGADVESASLFRATWSLAEFAALDQDAIALELSQLEGAKPAEAASARDRLVAEGFRAASRAQSRALLEGIAEQRSGRRSDEIVRLRHERQSALADREAALSALSVARREGSSDDAQQKLRDAAQRAADRAAELLADLRSRSPSDAELDAPSAIDPRDVQRTLLAPEGVFIQYADGQTHLYAYVISADSVTWHDLGERAPILEHAGDLLHEISDPAHLGGVGEVARTGKAVWVALMQPLVTPGTTKRIVVVPTPALATLPFEALVVSAPSQPRSFADLRFALDEFEVGYSPSAPVQSLLASLPPRGGEPRMLVLADPVVPGEVAGSSDVPRRRPETLTLARLPGTRMEALSIVDLVHSLTAATEPPPRLASDQRGGHIGITGADVYLGEAATEARLRDDARRYSVVHIAAHGAMDASDPRRSGLVLTAAGDDDGFLSVGEVLDLDLDADLVVLSACDTARGAVRSGEGVQSVARAFLYGGARSVIATLWQVDDRETEAVMRSFYKTLNGSQLSPEAALRQARLELRRAPSTSKGFVGEGRGEKLPGAPEHKRAPGRSGADLVGHPFFWAPFIAIAGSAPNKSH